MADVGPGYLLLVGVEHGDTSADVRTVVDKVSGLRVFPDEAGRMNLSIGEVEGSVVVVSQFTLVGDMRRGRRPSFTDAAPPEVAAPLIDEMVAAFRQIGIDTGAGVFGAQMEVDLVNDGPVTLVFSVRNAMLG